MKSVIIEIPLIHILVYADFDLLLFGVSVVFHT